MADVEAAVGRAQEIAGEKSVGVAAGTIARQCLKVGLLDEVAIDLVPVVLGRGRPYVGELTGDGRKCWATRPPPCRASG